MLQKFLYIFIISITVLMLPLYPQTQQPIQAQPETTTIIDTNIDDVIVDIESIDLDMQLPPELDPSIGYKLNLLKEYLILQTKLTKQHIVYHKAAYILSSLIAIGLITGGAIWYTTSQTQPPT